MEKTFKILNDIYKPVFEHIRSILKELKLSGYSYEWGFYNNHSVKQDDEWALEYYPIPVITVKDICDIGLDMNHTFIECKMDRENALCFDFHKFNDYKFEVYGVEDYLNDFYNVSLDLDGLKNRILNSDEQEIGITLMFNYCEKIDKLMCAVSMLKEVETYIL